MKQITINLYTYDELSDAAKERAKKWLFQCYDASDYDVVIEDAAQVAEALGITIDQTDYKTVGGRVLQEPDIRWSGFSSQGDGASFNGTWRYPEWNIVARVKKNYPTDLRLHSMAQVMHGMYEKYEKDRDPPCKLVVSCKYSNSGVSYAHSGWMDVEYEFDPDCEGNAGVSDEDMKIIRDTMRGFADWIYAQLREQDNYLHSDEHVEDTMKANEYTFEANGRRRDE